MKLSTQEKQLKNVSLKIPKNKISIFTSVSGSGKSSIVFDTITQEAGRQLNDTYDSFTRLFLPKYSRPEVDEIDNLSTAIVVNQKKIGGSARSTLGTITNINALFRVQRLMRLIIFLRRLWSIKRRLVAVRAQR
ncbi:hypothetical protein [Enterococcus faecium]|uniref:hypothetical protein n=1 Tax=Enterococcus faecium TaxID=1352 RepID=UPI001B7D64DC|nr:hypothetical protein [Enterococcus faecium]HCR2860678.1 hypothetical protein [Enterococcus faecium]